MTLNSLDSKRTLIWDLSAQVGTLPQWVRDPGRRIDFWTVFIGQDLGDSNGFTRDLDTQRIHGAGIFTNPLTPFM